MISKGSGIALVWILLLAISCQTHDQGSNDRIALAKVNEQVLYLEDVVGQNEVLNRADSAAFIQSLIHDWVQNEILFQRATQKISRQSEIDRLVRAYRKSLYVHHYEEEMVQQYLDSSFSQEELSSYYHENKSNFPLPHDLYQAKWVLTSAESIQADSLEFYLDNAQDIPPAMRSTIELSSPNYQLSNDIWLTLPQLQTQTGMKAEEIQHSSKGTMYTTKKDQRRLFFYLAEKKAKGEIAPFSYISGRIERILLHQRKEKYLSNLRKNAFQKAKAAQEIVIYE